MILDHLVLLRPLLAASNCAVAAVDAATAAAAAETVSGILRAMRSFSK